jgi:hypothetical protein
MYKFLNHYRYYLGSTFLLGFSPNTRLVVDDAFKLSGQSVQVGIAVELINNKPQAWGTVMVIIQRFALPACGRVWILLGSRILSS